MDFIYANDVKEGTTVTLKDGHKVVVKDNKLGIIRRIEMDSLFGQGKDTSTGYINEWATALIDGVEVEVRMSPAQEKVAERATKFLDSFL